MTLSPRLRDLVSGPASNIALTIFWAFFVYRFFQFYLASRDLISLTLAVNETIRLVFFLTRTRAHETSFVLSDWFIALGATFTAFLFLPGANGPLWATGRLLFVAGLCGEIASMLSLNRSFALVPARREIRTRGLYAFVRHPMYLAHLTLYLGFILWSASNWNAFIFLVFAALTPWRIANEERILAHDEAYRVYRERVRWRLLPGIY